MEPVMAKDRREAEEMPSPAEPRADEKTAKTSGLDDDLVRNLRELYDPMLEEPVPDEFVEILKRGRRPPK